MAAALERVLLQYCESPTFECVRGLRKSGEAHRTLDQGIRELLKAFRMLPVSQFQNA